MKGIIPGQELNLAHIATHLSPRGGVFSLHLPENRPVRDQDGPASLVSFENKKSLKLFYPEFQAMGDDGLEPPTSCL